MFRILDKDTDLFIKEVPYILNQEFHLSKTGRVWKSRGDLSKHIANNLDFYTQYVNRLEIVEYDFIEIDRSPIQDALDAKIKREKAKKLEERKRLIEYKLREIERLKTELEKLTGKA